MKFSLYITRLCLAAALVTTADAAIITYIGTAYLPTASTGQRQTWINQTTAQVPALSGPTDINFGTGCVSPCIPSTTSAGTNISGVVMSGVTFTGSVGATPGLYDRPVYDATTKAANSAYTFYNNGFTQWTGSLATNNVSHPSGFTSITITLPNGVRSVGFDFGGLQSASSGYNVSATLSGATVADSSTLTSNPGVRFDPAFSYSTSGPGFYGLLSTANDIQTVTISTGTNSGSWILNIANFKFYTAPQTATPEPAQQLTLGAALITISFLLRRRTKAGGNA